MKFIKYITPALFCAALTLQSCEHFLIRSLWNLIRKTSSGA